MFIKQPSVTSLSNQITVAPVAVTTVSGGGRRWASRGHPLSCWCIHRHGPGGLLLVGFLFPAQYSRPAAPRATRATSLVLGHRHPPAKPGLRLLPELGLGLNISNRFIKKNKNNKGYFDGNQIKEGSLMLTDCAGQGGGIRGREALSPAQLQPEPHSGPR